MIKVFNPLFQTFFEKNDILNKYQHIVFETKDIELAKKIFKLRLLKDVQIVKIRRPIQDPIVSHYNKLGYNIFYTLNPDKSENHNMVIIEVPSIDINEFEFIREDQLKEIDDKYTVFVSKYQMLWDEIYLSCFKYLN